MNRNRIGLVIGLIATGVAAFLLIGAIRSPTRGDGPDDPPYTAQAIADCLRSLRGNLEADENDSFFLEDDSHFVVGPDDLSADEFSPAPSAYVRIQWVFDESEHDTLQLQLYVAGDEADAESILQADLANALAGGADDVYAAEHYYRRGNVVFVWDEGGGGEEREQAHSCLVS